MRYLAIDLGDKRTGLATGDDDTKLVSPAGVLKIPRGEALVEAIMKAVVEHEPGAIIIGLPLHMDGTEGDRAKIAREFASDITKCCGLPVHLQDERLTIYAADQRMARSGRTHKQKKQIRDALAAAVILQDFLES